MWKILIRRIAACLLLALSGVVVRAEPVSGRVGEVPTITLHEAVANTLAHNPELVAFGYQREAQDGRVVQAGLAPNPELNVTVENALGTGDFSALDSAESTLSIAWILERGVRQRRVDSAQAGMSLLVEETDIKRLDAAAETARWFFACLSNQARMVNAREAVRLALDTVKAVQMRVAAGRSPQAELARAQAELARTELEQEDIEHELLSARRRLAAQWGETEPQFTRASGDLLALPDTESFEKLKTRISENPDSARYFSKQRVAEAELRLAREQRKSSWRVSVGVRRLEVSEDEALVGSISLPLALRNSNQGRIAEAQAQLAQTQADADAARIRNETLLFVLYQELLHSVHRVGTFREDVIPRLEQALTDTRTAYELGRYSYFEWKTVQQDLLEARSALLEASVDAHQKAIEIERLTGVRIAQPTISP